MLNLISRGDCVIISFFYNHTYDTNSLRLTCSNLDESCNSFSISSTETYPAYFQSKEPIPSRSCQRDLSAAQFLFKILEFIFMQQIRLSDTFMYPFFRYLLSVQRPFRTTRHVHNYFKPSFALLQCIISNLSSHSRAITPILAPMKYFLLTNSCQTNLFYSLYYIFIF